MGGFVIRDIFSIKSSWSEILNALSGSSRKITIKECKSHHRFLYSSNQLDIIDFIGSCFSILKGKENFG